MHPRLVCVSVTHFIQFSSLNIDSAIYLGTYLLVLRNSFIWVRTTRFAQLSITRKYKV